MFDPEEFVRTAKKTGQQASITMVCFNRWKLTQRSLASIFKNTHLPRSLIVVDNGSWDGTQGELRELRCRGKIDRLILLPENRGIAIGKNFGLRATEGHATWYCCIDNDIEVAPYWLSYLCYVSMLPGLGIIGSNVQGFGLPPKLRGFKPTKWKVVEGVILDNCPNPGGLYVVSASTFRKLGYFFERSLYGLEDSEWYLRQKYYKLRSVYVRNARCRELPGEEFAMRNGVSYRDFKTRAHGSVVAKVRALAKQGVRLEPRHYETQVTAQEVKQFTWRPQK